ncbi:MAG: hypothetical protein BGO98_42660 [Myxococcales bacterium 68-20]|nr:MAG: hypothetical protein BGO98_42660 [Myxococcales bacterium 68-20]
MKSLLRLALGASLVSSITLVHRAAYADSAEVKYTVVRGDTCAAIAARFYGDSRLVDIIHDANPGMGPAPHSLKAGRVLILPPKPAAPSAGPDARLTRTKNVVEVRAPEPRSGKPNDPLFRGNRVGTKERSTADVTFRDETQVKLGENTLVVILGDAQSRAAHLGARPSATETTLVTGSLRARLSELAGGSADKHRVATDSGAVEMKNGEAQVSVDEKKTTRLAVYDGASKLTAQRKSVDVKSGFGSKAETGRPPTPPKPLPDAPVWSTPVPGLALTEGEADLALAFAPPASPSGPAAAQWHIQLSRDADFDDLLVDTRVPFATRAIEAKGASVGKYYARASAIDDDQFEGKWSSVASVVVASLASTPLPGRKTRIEVTPSSVTCAIDGVVQQSPFEIDRNAAQTIACSTEDGGQRASLEMPRLPFGRVNAVAELVPAAGAATSVRVRLTDDAGAPIENVSVAVETAPSGMRIGPFGAGGAGAFVAPLALAPAATGGALRLRIAGETLVETNALSLTSGEQVDGPIADATTHLELTLAGRVTTVLNRPGFGGSLGIRLAMPRGPGEMLLGAEGVFEATPPGTSNVDGVGETRVRANVFGGRLPFGYRFGGANARHAPYITLAPELLGTRAHVGAESAGVRSSSLAAGLGASAGLEVRVDGRSAVFVELSGRYMLEIEGATSGPAIDASAAALSIGYRFSP